MKLRANMTALFVPNFKTGQSAVGPIAVAGEYLNEGRVSMKPFDRLNDFFVSDCGPAH